MADLMQFISSALWLALAVIAFLRLRQWNKRFSAMYDELKQQIEEMDDNAAD